MQAILGVRYVQGKTRFASAVLGGVLLAWLPVACGAESDVLTGRKGAEGSGGSGGNRTDADGGGARGTSRAGASAASAGTAGTTGAPVFGGSAVAGTGSGAAANGGAGGDSTSSAGGGAASSLNPHAADNKTLADGLCSLLAQYPCLSYPGAEGFSTGGAAGAVTTCSQSEQIAASTIPGDCFDAYAADMRCRTGFFRCPCTGNDCILTSPGSLPSPCPAEEQAFSDCLGKHSVPHGDTTGSARTCHWTIESNGSCNADCDTNAKEGRYFSADCLDGAPGGPQECVCNLNGATLNDGTPQDIFMTAGGGFLADDCAGIAQKMSDGQCDRVLNCCFTWTPVATPGVPTVERCSCLSDPKVKGLSTCAAVAAQGHGQVVALCPQFVSTGAAFPTADGGS